MTFYSKTIRGTKYRHFKSPDGKGRYAGRVHVQFYDREVKAWRFICGKMDGGPALGYCGAPGREMEDSDVHTTCRGCLKHTEVIDKLDADVPDLEDFQD